MNIGLSSIHIKCYKITPYKEEFTEERESTVVFVRAEQLRSAFVILFSIPAWVK